jgi:hypothetical protein
MLKVNCFFLVAAGLLLGLRPAAAAIKPCAELQAEIEAKLKAHKVKAYTLTVVDKAADEQGKIVGTCENSSKKIVYIRQQPTQGRAQVKADKKEAAPVPEPEQESAAAAEESQVEADLSKMAVTAQGIKPCPELKAEIEAKLKAHKVKAYELNIVSKNADAPGKVVGTCENSSKKIMYIRK